MARSDTFWIYRIVAVTFMLLLSAHAAPTLTLVAEQQLDTTISFSSLSAKVIQLSNGNYRLCFGGIATSAPVFAARDISINGIISVNATENTPTLPSSYTTASDISAMDSSLDKCFYSVLHSEVTTSSYAIVQADSIAPSANSISSNTNILTVNASSTTQTYLINSATQTLTTTFNSLSISAVTSMCGTVVNGSSVMYAVGRKSASVLVGFDGADASVDLSFTGYQVACDALSASQWIVCYDTETTSSTVTCINNQRVAHQVLQSASGLSPSRPHVSYLNSNSVTAVVLQSNLSAIGVVILDSSLQELLTLQIESTNYAQLTADAMNNVLSIVFSNATGAYVRTYLFDQGLSTSPSSAPVGTVTPISGPLPAISPISPPVPIAPVSSPTANVSTSTPSAAVVTTPTSGDSSATGADAKVLGPAIAIPLAAVAVGVFLLVFFLRKKKKAKAEKKDEEARLDGDANLSDINPSADPGRYSAIVSESKQGHYANISSAAKEDGINPTAIQPGEIDKRMQIPYRSLRFTKEIGAGSYGKVFVGEWRGAQVAIKVSNSITDIDGFLSEAKLTLGITPHPNLVQTFGVSLDGPNPCIVLEFCGGGSLDNVVFDREKHVTDEQRRDYALKIAYGLLHLHNNNIVHRDLAARNILLTNDGQPKISDFGMSRIIQEESSQGKTKTSFGPIRWMAPESLKDKSYSTKSDVWSYGILLYELVSGKEPHTEEDQLSIAVRIRDSAVTPVIPSNCDPVLKQVMEMCWKPDPNDRPSMETIAEFLRRH